MWPAVAMTGGGVGVEDGGAGDGGAGVDGGAGGTRLRVPPVPIAAGGEGGIESSILGRIVWRERERERWGGYGFVLKEKEKEKKNEKEKRTYRMFLDSMNR